MSIPILLTRLTLLTLFALGVYTIGIFSRTNTLFDQLAAQQSRHALPDGQNTPYDPAFTGVPALDDLLGFLVMFFYPIVDGGAPGLSLVGAAFGGQAVALVCLLLVEGGRTGARWKVAFFTSIVGLAGQLLGMGIVAPLYLFLHTLTSSSTNIHPTVRSLTPRTTAYLATIPATTTLTFLLPVIALSLPSPDLLPLHAKLQAHNLWQIFPLTGAMTHFILRTIWPFNPPTTPNNTLVYLRWVYKFALTVAVPAHLATTTLSVSAALFPTLFNPSVVGLLHPMNVFVPPRDTFSRGVKAASIAEGALWFLQWDYILSTFSFLVWAVAVRQSAYRVVGGAQVGWFGVGGFVKVAVRMAVLGPAGAAVVYVWERDEVVLAGWEAVERKKVQ